MDSTEIRAQLRNNIPPDMREGYDKLVTAGMKFMFDPKTHKYLLEAMQGEGEPAQKLGNGVAELLGFLLSQAKGAIPQHLLIPVGIELVLHAAEFAQQTGALKLDANTLGDAIQVMVFALFKKAGYGEEKTMAMIGAMEKQSGNPAPGEAQEEQPQQQAAPTTGLIGA